MKHIRTLVLLGVCASVLFAQSAHALPAGCKPRAPSQHLTAEAAERLRLAPGTTRVDSDQFRLRDGRVLVQQSFGGEGELFTIENFKKWQVELAEDLKLRRVEKGQPFHPLRGLIDDAKQFIAEAPALAKQMRARVSADGPEALDAFATEWRAARCRLDPGVFRELTAAIGELVIAKRHGHWSTRDEDGVSTPVIEHEDAHARLTSPPALWAAVALTRESWLAHNIGGSWKEAMKELDEAMRRAQRPPDMAPPAKVRLGDLP